MNFNVNLDEFEAGSTLSAIGADVVNNIFYDEIATLKRLRVHAVDNDSMSAWGASLKEHKKEDIELSKKVAGQASEKSLDFLDRDDLVVTDKTHDIGKEEKSGKHGTAEEKTVFVLSDEVRNEYQSAIVSSIGHDQNLCTMEPPIGTSLSLLGRGTHVWLVRAYVPGDPSLKGDELLIKTASMIYSSIRPPILANFDSCSDVILPGDNGYPMTVRDLKSDLHDHNFPSDYKDPMSETPVLHRLTLGTVGCPMWTYTTDIDLLTGFRDALQAHQRLCDEGILHRDICADNILLSNDSAAPFRGFITDLDFAHIDDLTVQQPKVTPQMSDIRQNKFLSPKPMIRRKIFEGTPQFMSRALLLQAKNRATRFVHGPNDDVESFIWVLSYCVMRNLYHQAFSHASKDIRDQSAYLRTIFHESFGRATPAKLTSERHIFSNAILFPRDEDVSKIIAAFMSEALAYLFEDIRELLFTAYRVQNPTPLITHNVLLTKVDDAIAMLDADGAIISPAHHD